MIPGVVQWEEMLQVFLPVFTQPSGHLFLRLASGWALCVGRHTVTRVCLVADPRRVRQHDAYHRFFPDGAWKFPSLWRLLAIQAVAACCPFGPISLALDDTLYHKWGRKVEGAGWWRDAVRSTSTKVVHAFGLNLVVLTLRVQPPWGGEPLGLPVNIRLHRKKGTSLLDLAEEMIREFASWFPDRDLSVCADGFYAPLAGKDIPRVWITSRMRNDAAIYAPVQPSRGSKKPGRPRKKGKRLPIPRAMARAKKGWREVNVTMRGENKRRLVLVHDVLWYAVSKTRLMRLVIVRDPDGIEEDDFLFTTNLSASPEMVAGDYADRWAIEDTFKYTKQLLGAEDPQTWKGQGPERAAAFSFWIYSMIWLWYLRVHGTRRTWNPLPWYSCKTTPSFADALAALRRALWAHRVFPTSDAHSVPRKIATTMIDMLATAA
jgi:hypothetical protein